MFGMSDGFINILKNDIFCACLIYFFLVIFLLRIMWENQFLISSQTTHWAL